MTPFTTPILRIIRRAVWEMDGWIFFMLSLKKMITVHFDQFIIHQTFKHASHLLAVFPQYFSLKCVTATEIAKMTRNLTSRSGQQPKQHIGHKNCTTYRQPKVVTREACNKVISSKLVSPDDI